MKSVKQSTTGQLLAWHQRQTPRFPFSFGLLSTCQQPVHFGSLLKLGDAVVCDCTVFPTLSYIVRLTLSNTDVHTMTGKMRAAAVDLMAHRTAKQNSWINVKMWILLRGTWRKYIRSGWCLTGMKMIFSLSKNCQRNKKVHFREIWCLRSKN